MTGYDRRQGPAVGPWQHGELVTERSTTRSDGAFYGSVRVADAVRADGGQSPQDVPGYGRVGGIDDPVPRADYGDDREAVRQAALDAAGDRDPADRDDARTVRYDVETDTTGATLLVPRPDDVPHGVTNTLEAEHLEAAEAPEPGQRVPWAFVTYLPVERVVDVRRVEDDPDGGIEVRER